MSWDSFKGAIAAVAMAASCLLSGCASDPPPPPVLTPSQAAARISERWARDELNHFRVALHSDTLIGCGVYNGLWKLSEVTDEKGYAWSTLYRLTDKGKQAVSAISLQESG